MAMEMERESWVEGLCAGFPHIRTTQDLVNLLEILQQNKVVVDMEECASLISDLEMLKSFKSTDSSSNSTSDTAKALLAFALNQGFPAVVLQDRFFCAFPAPELAIQQHAFTTDKNQGTTTTTNSSINSTKSHPYQQPPSPISIENLDRLAREWLEKHKPRQQQQKQQQLSKPHTSLPTGVTAPTKQPSHNRDTRTSRLPIVTATTKRKLQQAQQAKRAEQAKQATKIPNPPNSPIQFSQKSDPDSSDGTSTDDVPSLVQPNAQPKKTKTRPQSPAGTVATVVPVVGPTEAYEVERIIDCRFNQLGKKEYLVVWKGWDEHYNTWEPEHHLDCPALVKSYEENAQHQNKARCSFCNKTVLLVNMEAHQNKCTFAQKRKLKSHSDEQRPNKKHRS